MKYIATFYSHFGAIRFKREAPEGVTDIELRPVPRDLSSSCGTSASFDAGESFTFTDDPTGEIEQIVSVTDTGYTIIYESHNK
ncbi:hypothetical protein VEHSUH05_01575 [Veillonella denticariosi JCM 15641]|uniref:Putative Se/S carrier protein-like domain-containing protein n=1 Tax=Veillonella denticariosi JCM 15641 TaxID=1298594 RepID=A0A2S7ZD30_9FIRM|nr:DUF3343 domain-containing protein [Veillonella denticariosi]PQL21139.1 hypothetical protein VEHSUH05_01575 [Veillonella denticariosi JCM 15641]